MSMLTCTRRRLMIKFVFPPSHQQSWPDLQDEDHPAGSGTRADRRRHTHPPYPASRRPGTDGLAPSCAKTLSAGLPGRRGSVEVMGCGAPPRKTGCSHGIARITTATRGWRDRTRPGHPPNRFAGGVQSSASSW
jgi:hypothetical protein